MPRRYSMDSRQEETAARRRRLLDAAIKVLQEVGADRLTMEAVAEQADTATRTVYNHFASRDELIAAALELLLAEARDSLYLTPPADGDPAERLRVFVRLVYDVYGQQGDSLSTLLDHRDDPQIGPQVMMMRQIRRGHLEDILHDPQATLLLPVAQAAALAFVLTSHETWEALVTESGLTQPAALALVTSTLDAALFGHRPGLACWPLTQRIGPSSPAPNRPPGRGGLRLCHRPGTVHRMAERRGRRAHGRPGRRHRNNMAALKQKMEAS